MRKNNCELIRRELDELMINEACSASAAEHLKVCPGCREFHETQTKLRRMVGGLGTVAAPPDFDFRLRARLANDSSAFNYWPLLQRGFAVAAVLIVVGFGVVVVQNVVNERKETVAETTPPPIPVPQQSPAQAKTTESNAQAGNEGLTAHVPAGVPNRIRNERPAQLGPRVKRLSTVDSSFQRAEVFPAVDAVDSGATAVIPIDASLHSLKLSLDDGHGNAKTISVPTIRFGSQRMLPSGNQFAQKGIW